MRFMIMHKNDSSSEAGTPPSKQLIDDMGAFIGEYISTWRFLDGAGLLGSKHRTRLVFNNGRSTTKRGPYKGERELPAATLLLKVKDLDEAVVWAERYGRILGDGELELGKVTEQWDLGLMPAPENPPLQMLLIEKADKVTEGTGRSAQQKAAITRLKNEMTEAGVLQRGYDIAPSKSGKRLTFTNNQLRIMDGPFTESKELLGGFSIMELKDIDEAIAVAKPYAAILGGSLEVDVLALQ
jgi:hypothetical protein